jgi:excisionase family DNA binding protein
MGQMLLITFDPDNRLVAAELEARWNVALQSAGEAERRLRQNELPENATRIPDKETLSSLAHDLPAVWNSATTDMRLKQRIIRILIEEIIADVDEATTEIVLMLHWTGGRHSELRLKKNTTGRHSRCTSLEAIEIIRQMAGKFPDDQIAATLNRLNFRTGTGNTWTEGRIRSLRSYHEWPTYDTKRASRQGLTLEEASERLGVSHKIVRRLIDSGKISATQVVPCAPWVISLEAVESQEVLEAVRNAKRRISVTSSAPETMLSLFAGS